MSYSQTANQFFTGTWLELKPLKGKIVLVFSFLLVTSLYFSFSIAPSYRFTRILEAGHVLVTGEEPRRMSSRPELKSNEDSLELLSFSLIGQAVSEFNRKHASDNSSLSASAFSVKKLGSFYFELYAMGSPSQKGAINEVFDLILKLLVERETAFNVQRVKWINVEIEDLERRIALNESVLKLAPSWITSKHAKLAEYLVTSQQDSLDVLNEERLRYQFARDNYRFAVLSGSLVETQLGVPRKVLIAGAFLFSFLFSVFFGYGYALIKSNKIQFE